MPINIPTFPFNHYKILNVCVSLIEERLEFFLSRNDRGITFDTEKIRCLCEITKVPFARTREGIRADVTGILNEFNIWINNPRSLYLAVLEKCPELDPKSCCPRLPEIMLPYYVEPNVDEIRFLLLYYIFSILASAQIADLSTFNAEDANYIRRSMQEYNTALIELHKSLDRFVVRAALGLGG